MRHWIAIITLALGFLGGCGEVEESFDCADICDEFNDCLTGFDVDETSCWDSCEDNNTPSEVETCEECVESASNACVECSVQCEGVFVPASD